MALVNKTSVNASKHPYMRRDFWLNPDNHYWETEMYSEEGKNICREHINRIRNNVKRVKSGKVRFEEDIE